MSVEDNYAGTDEDNQSCTIESLRSGVFMFPRSGLLVAVFFSLLGVFSHACAEQPSQEQQNVATPPSGAPQFQLNDMAQAAVDLKRAGEALERFATSLNGTAEMIAHSLATMSSEFDPFGYKTAFRTLGQQAEMLRQQREIIHALQARELKRVQSENARLREECRRLRQGGKEKGAGTD